ncbi:MAG: protein-export chaperone SecB [Betaproteobacteria bacterium]|nr:protein-export chaperone SecB [Betaproteobacteria bacterium]
MSDQQPAFSIEKIYLKDLSLELPNAPQIFAEQEPPQVDIKLHNEVRTMDADLYEVVLTATVTARHNDKTAFLVEVAQAGVFLIRNFQPQDLGMVVNVTCPKTLLPYAREAVASVLGRAGFPPVTLPHVGFESIYQQRLQEAQQQQQPGGVMPVL